MCGGGGRLGLDEPANTHRESLEHSLLAFAARILEVWRQIRWKLIF